MYHLLRGLAQHHTVTLLSLTDSAPSDAPAELESLCREVCAVPRRSYNPASVRAVTGLLSPTPRSVLDTFQPEMAMRIEQLLKEEAIDLIIASQWWTAAYYQSFGRVPAIYEEVETGVFTSKLLQASTPLKRLRHALPLLKLRLYLRRLLPQFQACTVVSDVEKSLLQRLVPGSRNIQVIPNGVEAADYERADQQARQSDTMIFTGSLSYAANLDSMRWFLSEVFPKIQGQAPDTKLMITGHSDNFTLPQANNVILTGFVDNVRPLIASAWISLAPIRVGGGTRLKILEAMASGTPVVATTKGAEGLQVTDGEHILLADTPNQFANAVLRLLQDGDLHQRIADNSCRLVRRLYDWSVIMPDFLRLAQEATNVR